MYVEYKNLPVRGMGNVHGVWDCISLYVEYKLSMSYDTKSSQPDDDLHDTESLQPYISIWYSVTIYIVLVELIILGVLENFHFTTH